MFNETPMGLFNALDSAGVERFHAVPGMANQKNSEHSWGVATIILYLDPKANRDLILKALFHDCAERWTGDVPFHLKKRGNPEIKRLLDIEEEKWFEENGFPVCGLLRQEKILLKVADCLEGMKYCLDRFKCGEVTALDPYSEWINFTGTYILDYMEEGPVRSRATEVYDSLFSLYEDACEAI